MNLNISAMEYQLPAICDVTTPFVGVAGGKRSGKSRTITCLKAILLSSLHPGKPGLIASPTYGMTRRNLLPLLRELSEQMNIKIEGLDVKSPDCIKITWGDHEPSVIWLDVTIENYGRMNGLSLAWVNVDEVDKARYDDAEAFIEEATLRVSNPFPGQVAQINLTGAPEMNGYLHEYFVEKKNSNKVLHKWSMMQNEFLSEEYKRIILESIPASKRVAWVDGDFMQVTDGLVYEDYDAIENHTDLTIADALPNENIYVCWDLNNGGTSVVIGIRRGKHMLILDEWMAMAHTEAVINKVKQQPWYAKAVLSCDPACTQVLSYILKSGLKHNIMRSAPLIEHRVTAVNTRFGTSSPFGTTNKRHLLINTKKCKILNKCLMRQGYIKGTPDKKTLITEAKTDISGPIDALGYLVYSHFPYAASGAVAIQYRT